MKIGQKVILNGKRNHQLNGKKATIKRIFTGNKGKQMVEVDNIEGLQSTRIYSANQVIEQ